jgi:integrase
LGCRSDTDLDAGTLQVRRAVQRFGGDAAARRPLLVERKRPRAALKALDAERKVRQAAGTPDAALPTDGRAQLLDKIKTVRAALASVTTTVQVTELKSARSRRTIALPSVAIAALRAHRVRQLETRLAAGGRRRDNGLVLASAVGTPLDPRNVIRMYKVLLRSAGLPNVRVHDLRHSCATCCWRRESIHAW